MDNPFQSGDKQLEKPQSEDLTTLKSELKTELDTKVSGLNEKFDALQSQIQEVLFKQLSDQTVVPPAPKQEEEVGETWWDGFKQTPTKVMKDTVAPLLNDFKEKAKFEIKNEMNAKAEAARYDALALQQYPQLNDKEHPLFKEYQQVMLEKRKRDSNWDQKPEAVYDSAQIAFARLVARGELVPDAFIDEAKRMVSVGDSVVPSYVGTGGAKPVNQLTKSQQLWSQKLGVPQERYAKHMLRQ